MNDEVLWRGGGVMKNPLRYQISEYDCGPTSLLNALSFLFEREEIPPELIRNIMLYSLDCYGKGGVPGKNGTSRMAMMFLSCFMNGAGSAGLLPIESRYLSGKDVFLGENSFLVDGVRRKGVAVVRLALDGEHYVLFTKCDREKVFLFDPYYLPQGLEEEGVECRTDYPGEYNRIVSFSCFNREGNEPYALGEAEEREAVLIFDRRKKLTAESTIEYFI